MVNGNATPQRFLLTALAETDLFVTDILLLLVDAGMSTWSEFANKAALTNGCSLKWISQVRVTVFGEALKTNFELATMMQFGRMDWFRNGMRGRMSNVVGSAEGLPMQMDLLRMVPPWGLQLRKGSVERLEFVVNDNLTSGLDQFDITAYGFEREPD